MGVDLSNTTKLHPLTSEVLILSLVWKPIAMTIGIVGNTIIAKFTLISARGKYKGIPTASSYLIGSLAVADLLNCVTFYPIWIAEFTRTMRDVDSNQMVFCKFSRCTSWMLLSVSVANLLLTTLDRYIYITKPLKYPQIVTNRRTKISIAGM